MSPDPPSQIPLHHDTSDKTSADVDFQLWPIAHRAVVVIQEEVLVHQSLISPLDLSLPTNHSNERESILKIPDVPRQALDSFSLVQVSSLILHLALSGETADLDSRGWSVAEPSDGCEFGSRLTLCSHATDFLKNFSIFEGSPVTFCRILQLGM